MADPTVNTVLQYRVLTPEDYTRPETYAATRPEVTRASTLIPESYRGDMYYAVEQERVWSTSWVCVGYTSQVKNSGDMLLAEVADQPIFITRDKAGALRAFYNVCRHRGSQLVFDHTKHCNVIRCPYHSWGYGLDGKLLGAPYFDGLDVPDEQAAAFDTTEAEAHGFRKRDFGLLPVQVDSWGCFIFVNLDADAAPLSQWLGDLPERYSRYPLADLELVRSKPYRIHANWKLVAENFTEYYHLPWVHPELTTVSPIENHHRCQGPGMYNGFCTSPLQQNPQAVSFDLPKMPGITEIESQSAYFVLLFPNLCLFLMPDHLFTLKYFPSGPGLTLESGDMLVHPNVQENPAADEGIDRILSFWDMVNIQDIKAVEDVQRGLQIKAYPGGRMCFRFEEPVHRFQNMVIDRMTGIDRVPPGDDDKTPQH